MLSDLQSGKFIDERRAAGDVENLGTRRAGVLSKFPPFNK